MNNTPLAPCTPTCGGYFINSIARLTAENVRLAAEYEACGYDKRCKQIAREQNYNENRIESLRSSMSDMYALRRSF